ncbi:EXO84 Exocyst complex component EXO84 [Candida maltosa Xu316]
MWDKELQSLFKHVDGASKFIHPIPGRHIVVESGRWFEVNVGNWKPNNPSHLFILNDLILVAVKKTSLQDGGASGNSKARLQAVQCLPLNQVSLQQIKPPRADDKLYFINLKSKSLSYVYSTDRYDHFVKINEAFNKGRNEMIQKERLMDSRSSSPNVNGEHSDEKKQLRESLRNSGSFKEGVIDEQGNRKGSVTPNRNSTDQVLHDISARVHSRNRSHDFGNMMKYSNNGKSQFFNEIKTLEDRLDDVDVEVSHNQYNEAVELISIIESKLRMIENALTSQKGKCNITDELLLLDVSKLKIKNRKENVSNGLLFDLQHKVNKLKLDDIENILTLFDRLDQLDRGVQGYLDSMSASLSITVSRLIVGLQGSTKIDVVNYLSNMMVIYVSIVRKTIQTYETIIAPILKSHGDVDSSGLINWCIDEFTTLCKQIKKHLYGTLLTCSGIDVETDEPIYKVKDAKLYHSFTEIMQPQLEDLKSVGLNVDYIFESILNLE